MSTISFSTVITEDRIVKLPENVPIGRVEVIIKTETEVSPDEPLTIEEARRRLQAAGALSDAYIDAVSADTVRTPDEELLRMTHRPSGSKSIDELISEDRGEY